MTPLEERAASMAQFRAHDRRCARTLGPLLDAPYGPATDRARKLHDANCAASRVILLRWINRPRFVEA